MPFCKEIMVGKHLLVVIMVLMQSMFLIILWLRTNAEIVSPGKGQQSSQESCDSIFMKLRPGTIFVTWVADLPNSLKDGICRQVYPQIIIVTIVYADTLMSVLYDTVRRIQIIVA